jgi:hypothetical protein
MTQRLTITLPDDLARSIRDRAKEAHRPVSQVVVDALREADETAHQQRLAKAYQSISAEARERAEEWLPAVADNWPSD